MRIDQFSGYLVIFRVVIFEKEALTGIIQVPKPRGVDSTLGYDA
jgi:hypothetical protein